MTIKVKRAVFEFAETLRDFRDTAYDESVRTGRPYHAGAYERTELLYHFYCNRFEVDKVRVEVK